MPDRKELKNGNKIAGYYSSLFLLLVAIRMIITLARPYEVDMGGYLAWSRYLFEHGFADFYATFHVVYAPFYQYFLWMSGFIAQLFHLTNSALVYLIKLWPLLFECIGAVLIVRFSECVGRRNVGMILSLCYLLNPAVFINTSVWGQFDAIPATMLLATVYLFELKRPNLAALLFLAAVLTKPQSGLLLPLVVFLYFRDFRADMRSFVRLTTGIAAGIALYLAVVLPFYSPTALAGTKAPGFLDPFYWLIDLYSRSMKDYPYATANGANFWMLVGGQIQQDALPFLGLSFKTWGNIMLITSASYIIFIIYKGRASLECVIYCSYLILFSAFMWMTKMHERYLLPAVIFVILAVVWQRRHITAAILTSAVVFANQYVIYLMSFDKEYWLPQWDATGRAIALATLITYGLALFNGYNIFANRNRRVIITKVKQG